MADEALMEYARDLNEAVNKAGNAVLDLIDRDDSQYVMGIGWHVLLNGAVYLEVDDELLITNLTGQFAETLRQVMVIRKQRAESAKEGSDAAAPEKAA